MARILRGTPPPPALTPKQRARVKARLKVAREKHNEARAVSRVLDKDPKVRAARAARRARHAANHAVWRLKRQLDPTASRSGRRRRRLARAISPATARERDRQFLKDRAEKVWVCVDYDGHDAAVDATVNALVRHFGGEVSGSGYSFLSERRDLDMYFRPLRGEGQRAFAMRLYTVFSALLSNAPLATLQVTTHAVFFVDGAR